MWKVTIDKEKCNDCGECVDNCPGEVHEMQDGKPVPVNPEECHGCHTCESVCDQDAVQVEDE